MIEPGRKDLSQRRQVQSRTSGDDSPEGAKKRGVNGTTLSQASRGPGGSSPFLRDLRQAIFKSLASRFWRRERRRPPRHLWTRTISALSFRVRATCGSTQRQPFRTAPERVTTCAEEHELIASDRNTDARVQDVTVPNAQIWNGSKGSDGRRHPSPRSSAGGVDQPDIPILTLIHDVDP